jgi:hypothetical protein
MKQLTIFRILTFILVPIAVLFGVMSLVCIVNSFSSLAFLLIAFIFGAFVIYTFSSLIFLNRGLDKQRVCNPSLRDWIKVNAYVSTFMGVMMLMNTLTIFSTGDITLRQALSQMLETQPANMRPKISLELYLTMIKAIAWFMFFFSLILLTHIQLNFRIIKKNPHLFGDAVQQ